MNSPNPDPAKAAGGMTEPTDDECVAWFKCRSIGESFNEEDWRAREILLAELARLSKLVAEREEWVMVPREPTREMWAAMGDAVVGLQARQNHSHDAMAEAVYQAALAAAPLPPAPLPVGGEAVDALADMQAGHEIDSQAASAFKAQIAPRESDGA